MKSEQAALALETEMKRSEQAGLETIKSLYQNEIGSLRGQVEALSQEKESIGTQLNQLRAMAAKGLALSPTMFALERSFAQVSNEQMSAETAIVKAQENISLAEQRVTDLQQERRRAATEGAGEDKRRYCRRARKNHDGNAGAWHGSDQCARRCA